MSRYLYMGLLLAALPGMAAASPESVAPQENTVADGPVTVTARVDRRAAQVAEPIRLTLEVVAPKGTRVELPQLGDRIGEFTARNAERMKDIPADESGSTRRWTLSTQLDTIKTGDVVIPSLEVHYITDATSSTFESLSTKTLSTKTLSTKTLSTKTLSTTPITVQIKSVLEHRADPTKFRDIKETVDVAVPETNSYAWLGWTAAGVGGAIAIALATLAIVKRQRGPSPAEWALAAIADLEKLPITSSADAEAAYNEVVDVIREYFELEFNIPVLAKTTREFLTETTKFARLEPTSKDRLASLASIADEIKFARLGVGASQVKQALDQAKAFVTECEACRRAAEKEAA